MKTDLLSLLDAAKFNKKENDTYLRGLRNVKEDMVFGEILKIHQDVFAKTDCLQCANCCKTIPALLTSTDIKRMAAVLEISAKQFKKKYVLEDIDGEMTLNGVPCRFLQANNHCSIYDHRPESCRRFPHTDEKEYPRRAVLNLANTMVCPAASQVLIQLKNAIPLS
jgi:uncharacterized protein